MRTAPNFARVAKPLLRTALWFCACNLLASALAAQCSNPTQVPNQTISSGTVTYTDSNALAASNVVVNGSATVMFYAGHCIDLQPGFHATAGTAGTTFHAWVDIAPTAVSVSPPSGSGLTQPFTWTVSSPTGYWYLSDVYALFNSSPSGANACYIRYNPVSNLLYVADNSGSNWSSGIVPGNSGTTGNFNSHCSISGSGSSFSHPSGTQLAVTVSVTFQAAFSGNWTNYLLAYDQEGLNSAWQPVGNWTVVAPADFTVNSPSVTVTAGSQSSAPITITPINGFNSSVTFTQTSFPTGLTLSFQPNPASGSTTAYVTAASNLSGSYMINFSATSGNLSHTGSISVNVVALQTYTISGQVTTMPTYTLSGTQAQPLVGVRLSLSGSQTGSATTDSMGSYSFTVASGGSYTVTPSMSPYTFTPSSTSCPNMSSNCTVAFQADQTCKLDVAAGVDSPLRSGNNEYKGGGWQYPTSIKGSWSLTMTANVLFKPAGGSESTVASQSTSFSWDPNTPTGTASQRIVSVTTPLEPYGTGAYHTRVDYVGTCGGVQLPLNNAPGPTWNLGIYRPAYPNYGSPGGPVTYLGTYSGRSISSDGDYRAYTPVVAGYTNGATGTPNWILLQATSGLGYLDCTNCSSPNFIATYRSQGCMVYDVQIKTSYDGFTSDPFYVFINAPYKTWLPKYAARYTDNAFLDGYDTFITYSTQDMCGNTMNNYDIGETLDAIIPDYPGANWLGGTPGSYLVSGTDWADEIRVSSGQGNCTSLPCVPLPMNPPQDPLQLGTTKVDHLDQIWWVGCPWPCLGVPVQSDTLQRYQDHGAHENVVSPYLP